MSDNYVKEEKCNGYLNTATWLTVIHIQNDSIDKGCNRIYVSEELQKTPCYKSIEDFAKKALSLANIKSEFDYHGDFTKKINWQEVFNQFVYDPDFPDDGGCFLVANSKELLKLFTAEGEYIYLPDFQIDRDFYKECKETIESYGYKYKSKKFYKQKADAEKDLIDMINGVEVLSARKKFDFFPTPQKIVDIAQELLEHDDNSRILEPSCGIGNLVKGLEKFVDAVEINEDCVKELKDKGIKVVKGDFLEETPKRYDYIIMNPPFGNRNDCKHTIRAYKDWLNNGGVLVSITSSGLMNNSDKYSKEFSELYKKSGVYQEIFDCGEFKESGTNISTMISKFIKNENISEQTSLFDFI